MCNRASSPARTAIAIQPRFLWGKTLQLHHARIPDADLWKTAALANLGRIDADTGGGVIKQRIARSGEGKSGSTRSIILFQQNHRIVFVYGFEKKDQANINARELEAFRELATVILGYTDADMARRVADGALLKIEKLPGDDDV